VGHTMGQGDYPASIPGVVSSLYLAVTLVYSAALAFLPDSGMVPCLCLITPDLHEISKRD
jgi:hypothetical protein